jgi:hypothetical protein
MPLMSNGSGVPEIVDLPSSLDFLFRRKSLTDKEFLQLAEWLAELIYSKRESICQQEIGNYDPKNEFSSFKPLSQYQIPEISGLPLSTRGVWFWKFHVYSPDEGFREITVDGHTAEFREEIDHIWGYTRDGYWSVATISYLHERDFPDLGRSPYRKVLKVHAEKVKSPQDISRIVGIKGSEISIKLILTLERWYEKRKKSYESAKDIHVKVVIVYNMLSKENIF